MELIRELKPKGIVVIPKDIRESVSLRIGDKLSFKIEDKRIVIEKKEQDVAAFFKKFFKYQKKGKEFTLQEIKKYEEESYEIS